MYNFCVPVNAASIRKGNEVGALTEERVNLVIKDNGPGKESKAVQGECNKPSPY